MKKGDGMGLGPTSIPSNFETDPNHYLDTKNIKDLDFPILIIFELFLRKTYTVCLGRGMCSPSALVWKVRKSNSAHSELLHFIRNLSNCIHIQSICDYFYIKVIYFLHYIY